MTVTATRESPGDTAVLRVRGLSARYGPLTALHDVDLELRRGEVVGLAGDNGAGKSTLLRCISGDVDAAQGDVWLDGERLPSHARSRPRAGIGVVWQHLVLSDNLDVASNLLLGKERRRWLTSGPRLHAQARGILHDLGIPIADSTRPASDLTAAERQLLAVARAVSPAPRLLLLDEPTAALSRADSAHVEQLIRRFRDQGTTILLVSHDVDQLLRLTDRVVVLRRGHVVTEVDPAASHPDELLALMAGHDAASVPRRQLSRLHALAGQLSSPGQRDSVGPAAGLPLILSTLGAALGTGRLSLHLLDDATLRCVGSVGLSDALEDAWRSVPLYATTGPLSVAVVEDTVVVDADVRVGEARAPYARLLDEAGIASWWAVPFSAGDAVRGVISVYRTETGSPRADELDLVTLYAGYAAAALEREHLLAELTARNGVLETIRSVLQTLAGPAALEDGVAAALRTLREAVGADEVGLYEDSPGAEVTCRAFAGPRGAARRRRLGTAVAAVLGASEADSPVQVRTVPDHGSRLFVRLSESTALAAQWNTRLVTADERVLLEDAGHSILLALERERSELAHREMAALRRSQELQRQFLARLSHELRTPLTAIRGYASSLMQTDVTWDEASTHRFLSRIGSESARLRRLVDDLLDFSMIESGMLRVRPDWVDLRMVVDAALSCLAPEAAAAVHTRCAPQVPPVWADHDRLEQVMVNLMDNAVRHNPPGTTVGVDVRLEGAETVVIEVTDDGNGMPPRENGAPVPQANDWRGPTESAGLGLLITHGIVDAHHGTILHEPRDPGTRSVIRIPVEPETLPEGAEDA